MLVVNNFYFKGFGPLLEDKLCLIFKLAPSVCRMTFPILASLLVRLVVLLPFQLLRLSLATPSKQATTNQNVKKRPACSELRWAYCNHKATYFASYLTGGDCVPDDQNTWPYGYSMPIEIGRAVQQECRDRSRMPSSA